MAPSGVTTDTHRETHDTRGTGDDEGDADDNHNDEGVPRQTQTQVVLTYDLLSHGNYGALCGVRCCIVGYK